MSSHVPVAYTYEADYHCPGCAEERFGLDTHSEVSGEDREGNPVHAVFSWNEGWQGHACGTCGGEL